MGFEPTSSEFGSEALTDWAIRSWVQLILRANFVQLLHFHRLLSVQFHFGYCLSQSPRFFQLKFYWGNHVSVAEWSDIYGTHHWRIMWSSYRKLAWVRFEPTTTKFRSDTLTDWTNYQAMSSTHTQSQPCTATPTSSFALSPISFRLLPSLATTFILTEIGLR